MAVLIGIGANLASPVYGPPLATCQAALKAMAEVGIRIVRRSRWYQSAPVPISDQPWYVNGVVAIDHAPPPYDLLGRLQGIEADFGRQRGRLNAARVIDLDILAYDDLIATNDPQLIIPHPRMHQRGFVLLPLAELIPDWRAPSSGHYIDQMIADLPNDQECLVIDGQ